jgi:hypothetical protein
MTKYEAACAAIAAAVAAARVARTAAGDAAGLNALVSHHERYGTVSVTAATIAQTQLDAEAATTAAAVAFDAFIPLYEAARAAIAEAKASMDSIIAEGDPSTLVAIANNKMPELDMAEIRLSAMYILGAGRHHYEEQRRALLAKGVDGKLIPTFDRICKEA